MVTTDREQVERQLTDDDLRKLYELMLLTRRIDERMWALNRQGKVAAMASCQGQEAAQVGSVYALEPQDYVVVAYREHGVAVARGMPPRDIMAFALGRDADPNTRGRQIPGHYSSRKLNMLSSSSPVGTQIPHAVGAALTAKTLGQNAVAIVYFGEGATSKGDFHEACNWAGVQKLPVIFFCQNNEYAISVPQRLQMAVKDVADRAAGYGFPGVVVDGNDVVAVYAATQAAAARARAGDGPTLIEAKTTRLLPHTSEDDDRRYRPREDVEAAKKRDPLPRLAADFKERGLWDDLWAAEVEQRVAAAIEDAQAFAENAPDPEPEEAVRWSYAE
jgi:2-oxoisovalerate dehydrogenase E1 component alpha subunit